MGRRDDAEAGGAGAVNILVSGVPAVGWDGGRRRLRWDGQARCGGGRLGVSVAIAAIYCGGWAGCGSGCCCLSLSLPPPKIFWKKFFFLGCPDDCVVSEALPFGGAFGLTRTMGAGAGGIVVSGLDLPPRPRIFWMRFCGFSPIWLQVLTGAVPSRKAA